jgi:hypothetical protein
MRPPLFDLIARIVRASTAESLLAYRTDFWLRSIYPSLRQFGSTEGRRAAWP